MISAKRADGNSNSGVERERVGDRVTISRDPAKSPNWYIKYSEGKQQIRYSLRTRNKKRAFQIATKKDAELVLGKSDRTRGNPISIADAKDHYLRALKLARKDDGTLDGYRRDLEQFAAYARWKGVVRLDQVDASLLEGYQERLETDGMKGIVPQKKRGRRLTRNRPKTVRNKLKTVRQLQKWAVKRKWLQDDSGSGFQLPPEPAEKAHCWTPQELQEIRRHAEDNWRERFDFLAMTGLRSDEFCWLLRDDVHFGDRPFLTIQAKTCPQTGLVWHPKHRRERTVPLGPIAAGIAERAYRASTGPWLFQSTTSRGPQRGHLKPAVVLAALGKAKMKAGVVHGTVHTFRHVFCSFMANSNVPPFQVMTILGHGSLDIVLRYYHLAKPELLRALDGVAFEKLQSGNWQERR